MASVTIFAFIDKEGICTENHRYIDEIVLINGNRQRQDRQERKVQVLQLHHNPLIKKEDKIYQFNVKHKYNQNINSLKALGVAFMLTKSPKKSDNYKQLQEIFLMDQLKQEKEKTGSLVSEKQQSYVDNQVVC